MKGKQNLVGIRRYSNLQPEFSIVKEALSKEGIEAVFSEHGSFRLYHAHCLVIDILVKREDVEKAEEVLKRLEESLKKDTSKKEPGRDDY